MATDTSTYQLNHSMLRVKDPQRSIKFYEFLGLKLIQKLAFQENKFDLYFLAYDSPKAPHHGKHWTDREGIVELTHNYGSEHDSSFTVANGNSDPGKGFGHICISVDNIQAACQRIEDAGYKFQKRLQDGKMRSVAFVQDPDTYWVEIISRTDVSKTEGIRETDPTTYRLNHTMLRVKDADRSLAFYQDIMGMKLIRTREQKESGFNLYFLRYQSAEQAGVNQAEQEGLLELTWNYGTEKDSDFRYHSGNEEPKGFGHICISVDNLEAACSRFEKENVKFIKRPQDGRMKMIAFIQDVDGYWIEIVQNEKLKPQSKA
ncbi:MAG: Lactoylglutathione lyase [Caeruleum heppii]|nr:MAG: Lactoylglutathione lyase [Caeruleum heppii]